jgi:hypothetical protein
MSVYADANVNPASFYLGSVDARFAGATMVLTLFDPGEGAKTIEILDPNGNTVSFDWETIDDLTFKSGSGSSIDVSGTSGSLPNRVGSGTFNERLLALRIPLPTDYATRYGTKTWWKIRHRSTGSDVTDRTTWAMSIPGTPTRLLPT